MINQAKKQPKYTIRDMVITALFISLVLVFTMFINIRLPIAANGGLIHLGNVPLFVAAVCLGKNKAALAGGIGMALFDVLSSWTSWAPFTLVIVGLMGYVSGLILEKKQRPQDYIFAVVVALLIKVFGYYLAEWFLYGNLIAPLTSIPGNIIQVVTGGIIAYPVALALKKVMRNF